MIQIQKFLLGFQLSGFRSKRDDFYEQMAKSYESKESLRDFLTSEYEIASAKRTKNPSRAMALKIIRARLASGQQPRYSQLLSTVMPDDDKMLLAALDDAKDKPELMRFIAASIRNQRKMNALVKGKLVPPLMILPGAFAFSYVMATKSLPIIVKIAPPEVWGTFNMSVRVFADFVATYGLMSVGIAILLIIFYFYQLPRWTGPIRGALEKIGPGQAALLFPIAPYILPLGIYRDIQAGKLFSALSVMLQSGKTLSEALIEVRNSSQPWMRMHIRRVIAHLEVRTTDYSNAFAKGLLSPQVLSRLSSQIRTNPHFDQVLIEIGNRGSEDIFKEVDKQTSVVNSILLAFGGAVVAFMMIGQLNIGQSMTDEMSPQKQMQKRMKAQQAAGQN